MEDSVRRVKNGTPISTDNLCLTCRYGQITQGLAESQSVIFCDQVRWVDDVVPYPITKCSEYSNKNETPLSLMKEQAWTIRTDASGQKCGFTAPGKKSKEDKEWEDDNPIVDPLTGRNVW